MTDVKPRRRDINAALTRSAVLDAARELFVSKGFEATSIEEIARGSQSSNGAVYHHFRDKQEIFAEVFRASQAKILEVSVARMPAEASAWHRVEVSTRAFLRAYVEDTAARTLLGQALRALGWDRVRALDEQMSLPLIRAVLSEAVEAGEANAVPVATAAELLFTLYCNAVLMIASAPDPHQAATDAEAVIFALLGGLRAG